jgi:hypothetical protein
MISSIILKKQSDPVDQLEDFVKIRPNTSTSKKIKITSGLDDGLDNDGLDIKGLVIGKPYVLEAVDPLRDASQTDVSQIIWAYQYQIEEVTIEGVFGNVNGQAVSLTVENLDVCGRFVTIYAIGDVLQEIASINVWVHFRFRYFSKKIITAEIAKRIAHPFLINQNSTSLCGMAAVFYSVLKINPALYRHIALEFHQKGTVTLNNYTIKPNKFMFDVKPTTDNLSYPGLNKGSNGLLIGMPLVDWILLAGARSSLSSLNYKGDDGDNFKAINWRGIVKKMLKDFFGYKTIIDYTRYYTGFNYKNSLVQIEEDYKNGYQIVFLIDANMLENKVRYILNALDWHYIVYEGDLSFDEHKNYIFSYYSWGRIYKKQVIRSSVFNSTFYGYYKIKI